MKEFIIVLAEKDVDALGYIRCHPQAQAAKQEGQIWLRGIFAKEQPELTIRQLPAQRTYRLGDGNLLFLPGGLTPVGELPKLPWQPLTQFLPVELPVSALPAVVQRRVSLQVIPSGQVEQGAALLADWPVWATYADTAPIIRLQRLRFAASAHGKALILGDVLPPMPGREYWMRDGILLPGGFDFEFPVVSELVQEKHNPDNDAVLLFDENGSMDKISRSHFVAATRSAVRKTTL